MQNRPNPFVTYHDPDTEIRFSLEQTDNVSIVIYDMLAQRIRTLYSRSGLSANDYVARWDGRNDHGQQVASGHYFYRMVTSRGSVTKRMTVIK
jgi:flagellar hook assembly protein FlgD